MRLQVTGCFYLQAFLPPGRNRGSQAMDSLLAKTPPKVQAVTWPERS
jgi:hypothetical protein